MEFYRDSQTGERVFYGSAAHRPLRARRSPQPTTAANGRRRQPTATEHEPREIGAIFRAAVINTIEQHRSEITRGLLDEALILACERATAPTSGWGPR